MTNKFYNYLVRLNEYERKKRLSDSLAVDLTEFENRWNKYAEEFQFAYRRLEIDYDNRFLQIRLHNNKNIGFIGDVTHHQDERILKNVTMIASGDGSHQSGANIIIAIGILIACLNPNEDVEFRKQIFERLGLNEFKIGMKNVIVVNDFKYSINVSNEFGLLFSVSREK